MTHALVVVFSFVAVWGAGGGVLPFLVERRAAAPAAPRYSGKCIYCAAPINRHGECPNVQKSGIERFDRRRIYCGHAEVRDRFLAGAA